MGYQIFNFYGVDEFGSLRSAKLAWVYGHGLVVTGGETQLYHILLLTFLPYFNLYY